MMNIHTLIKPSFARHRQRALENMGYDVLRVKNEEIQNALDCVAERIIQRYFEVIEEEQH